jgi:hypothetical protein
MSYQTEYQVSIRRAKAVKANEQLVNHKVIATTKGCELYNKTKGGLIGVYASIKEAIAAANV